MIGTPSDIVDEVAVVQKVLAEWNRLHSSMEKIVMLPLHWAHSTYPATGTRPQASIAGAPTPPHYAEELLGNTQKQATPVIGWIGQETIETVLPNLCTQQPKPLGFVKAEYADLKQTDEQKVKKQR